MKNIKENVLEIVEIAKACPDNLQQVCFQTLLTHFLQGLKSPPATEERQKKPDAEKTPSKDADPAAAGATGDAARQQDDLKDGDLHLKAKKFLQKEALSVDHLNNLFYKEAGNIMPLYDDLKTTRMAESQIRIALLQSLVNAISSGDFETQVEAVRTECTRRKCYDSNNFTAALKNNKSLFDFSTFDKTTKTVRLSEAGKKELSDLIKKLQ